MNTHPITSYYEGRKIERSDLIADENALSIDIISGPLSNRSHYTFTTAMRSRGHDKELTLGLLYSLGIIDSMKDIWQISLCDRGALQQSGERLTVELSEHRLFSPLDFSFGHQRFSSCGVCGSQELPALGEAARDRLVVSPSFLLSLPQKMKKAQTLFNQTGGYHAASIFDGSGNLLHIFEDIGRHNALDKLVGSLLIKNQLPLTDSILLLSSRASFEMVQKASRASIPMVLVMGAVTTLACAVAKDANISLVGFLRDDRFNIYTHPQRIV